MHKLQLILKLMRSFGSLYLNHYKIYIIRNETKEHF
jgi:uncharacterized pyridoxamine 5'-phosphate oxidase family protein